MIFLCYVKKIIKTHDWYKRAFAFNKCIIVICESEFSVDENSFQMELQGEKMSGKEIYFWIYSVWIPNWGNYLESTDCPQNMIIGLSASIISKLWTNLNML